VTVDSGSRDRRAVATAVAAETGEQWLLVVVSRSWKSIKEKVF